MPIEEGLVKNAVVGAAIVASTIGFYHGAKQLHNRSLSIGGVIAQKAEKMLSPSDQSNIIQSKYKVDGSLADKIVAAAHTHENKTGDFPKAHHLLGLAATESSFNPNARSKLRRQPAIGLTQIRPKMNGLTPAHLASVDDQMHHASRILQKLRKHTSSDDDALTAYNNGLAATMRGGDSVNYKYAPKVMSSADEFKSSTH